MDNELPDKQSSIDWVSYHESKPADIDVDSVVALVRRVGGELQSIDEKNVGGSTNRALQIDKQKLISDLQRTSSQTQKPTTIPSATPVEPVNKPQQEPPLRAATGIHEAFNKSREASVKERTVNKALDIDISNIESRLTRLESATKAFRSAKKIKKGSTYNVSSNSMKGQLKDASLLAEFIMAELAKGVKTITIKLHENTDTKSS